MTPWQLTKNNNSIKLDYSLSFLWLCASSLGTTEDKDPKCFCSRLKRSWEVSQRQIQSSSLSIDWHMLLTRMPWIPIKIEFWQGRTKLTVSPTFHVFAKVLPVLEDLECARKTHASRRGLRINWCGQSLSQSPRIGGCQRKNWSHFFLNVFPQRFGRTFSSTFCLRWRIIERE